jgi:zinc/manganese transport system substrate-binding protein
VTRRLVVLSALALVLPVLALAACSPTADPADDGVLRVVASTNVYGDLAATVGGPDVEVVSIIDDPGQDPHGFEASPRVQLALAEADLVIANGGGYDPFVSQMLEASGNDAPLLDAVEIAGLAGEYNEHVWYDFAVVAAVAGRIAEELAALDPAGADGYRERAGELADDLADLADRAGTVADAASGRGVIVTEPVPLYLLEACGLRNLTPAEFSEAIEEDVDVPPALLQDVLDLLGDGSADLVVYNAQTGGPQTDAVLDVAGDARIPAIAVTETLPDGLDYVAWQRGLIDLIADALDLAPLP